MAATLSDIYGPQTLLHDALLPASLIFAHPHYLRPAFGLWPAGGNGLHVAAFDLAQGTAPAALTPAAGMAGVKPARV